MKDEYISQKKAIEWFKECLKSGKPLSLSCFVSGLESMHTDDVRPVIFGEWIEVDNDSIVPFKEFRCSVCGASYAFPEGVSNPSDEDMNFCPNCGMVVRHKKVFIKRSEIRTRRIHHGQKTKATD